MSEKQQIKQLKDMILTDDSGTESTKKQRKIISSYNRRPRDKEDRSLIKMDSKKDNQINEINLNAPNLAEEIKKMKVKLNTFLTVFGEKILEQSLLIYNKDNIKKKLVEIEKNVKEPSKQDDQIFENLKKIYTKDLLESGITQNKIDILEIIAEDYLKRNIQKILERINVEIGENRQPINNIYNVIVQNIQQHNMVNTIAQKCELLYQSWQNYTNQQAQYLINYQSKITSNIEQILDNKLLIINQQEQEVKNLMQNAMQKMNQFESSSNLLRQIQNLDKQYIQEKINLINKITFDTITNNNIVIKEIMQANNQGIKQELQDKINLVEEKSKNNAIQETNKLNEKMEKTIQKLKDEFEEKIKKITEKNELTINMLENKIEEERNRWDLKEKENAVKVNALTEDIVSMKTTMAENDRTSNNFLNLSNLEKKINKKTMDKLTKAQHRFEMEGVMILEDEDTEEEIAIQEKMEECTKKAIDMVKKKFMEKHNKLKIETQEQIKKIKDNIKEINKQDNNESHNIKELIENLNTLKEKIKLYKIKNENYFQNLENKIVGLENSNNDIKTNLVKYETKDTADKKIEIITNQLNNKMQDKEINDIKMKINNIENELKLQNQDKTVKLFQIQKIESEINNIKDKEKQMNQNETKINKIIAAYQEIEDKFENWNNTKKTLKEDIDKLKEKIEDNILICEKKIQEVTKIMDNHKQLTNESVNNINNSIKELNKKIKVNKDNITNTQTNIETIKNNIGNIMINQKTIGNIQSKIEKIQQDLSQNKTILTQQNNNLATRVQKIENTYQNIEKNIEAPKGEFKEDIQKIQQEINQIKQDIKTVQDKIIKNNNQQQEESKEINIIKTTEKDNKKESMCNENNCLFCKNIKETVELLENRTQINTQDIGNIKNQITNLQNNNEEKALKEIKNKSEESVKKLIHDEINQIKNKEQNNNNINQFKNNINETNNENLLINNKIKNINESFNFTSIQQLKQKMDENIEIQNEKNDEIYKDQLLKLIQENWDEKILYANDNQDIKVQRSKGARTTRKEEKIYWYNKSQREINSTRKIVFTTKLFITKKYEMLMDGSDEIEIIKDNSTDTIILKDTRDDTVITKICAICLGQHSGTCRRRMYYQLYMDLENAYPELKNLTCPMCKKIHEIGNCMIVNRHIALCKLLCRKNNFNVKSSIQNAIYNEAVVKEVISKTENMYTFKKLNQSKIINKKIFKIIRRKLNNEPFPNILLILQKNYKINTKNKSSEKMLLEIYNHLLYTNELKKIIREIKDAKEPDFVWRFDGFGLANTERIHNKLISVLKGFSNMESEIIYKINELEAIKKTVRLKEKKEIDKILVKLIRKAMTWNKIDKIIKANDIKELRKNKNVDKLINNLNIRYRKEIPSILKNIKKREYKRLMEYNEADEKIESEYTENRSLGSKEEEYELEKPIELPQEDNNEEEEDQFSDIEKNK